MVRVDKMFISLVAINLANLKSDLGGRVIFDRRGGVGVYRAASRAAHSASESSSGTLTLT